MKHRIQSKQIADAKARTARRGTERKETEVRCPDKRSTSSHRRPACYKRLALSHESELSRSTITSCVPLLKTHLQTEKAPKLTRLREERAGSRRRRRDPKNQPPRAEGPLLLEPRTDRRRVERNPPSPSFTTVIPEAVEEEKRPAPQSPKSRPHRR